MEHISENPSGSLPQLDIDPAIVRKFFADTLCPDEFDKIPPEAIRALKCEKYVPASGDNCDLDTLEVLVRDSGRIRVSEPGAINEMYREYGKRETLQRNFEQQVGLTDQQTLEAVRSSVAQIAVATGAKVVDGSVFVLDDMGENGAIRAYSWPFVGLQNETVTLEPPANAERLLKERLSKVGVKPWRAGTIFLNPSGQTQKGATVCVFTGK